MQHMQHPSSSSFMLQWKMILDILKGAIVLVPFSVDTVPRASFISSKNR